MPFRKSVASVAVLACFALAGVAHAEVTGVKLTLSPYAGYVLWDQNVNYSDRPIYGGRAGLWFGRYIAIEGSFGYHDTDWASADGADANVHHYGGDLLLHLTRPRAVTPYILGGWSRLTFYDNYYESPAGTRRSTGAQSFDGWEAGLGLKFMLGERVHLRLEGRDVMIDRDAPAGVASYSKYNTDLTHNFIITAGFDLLLFGHVKDSDEDGISDRKDKCPGTPPGCRVDAMGCPVDSDGDGVCDGLDQCGNTPKGVKVDAKGCAVDSDGDGVSDATDQCANTATGCKVDAKGCPIDGDGDGVCDGLDQCANTISGCKVDAKGCPTDSDNDGVCDGLDQCANTAAGARVDAKGCPIVVSEKETQFLDTGIIRLSNVNFATGKADLMPDSYEALDQAGKILNDWPQLQIEVGGHTDSRGAAAANQKLSEARAEAVKNYLFTKFPDLKASQFSVKGYGESQPIADNKTEMGRAQNRRVEFKVLNREVLKKEIEKRKTLQKP